MESRKGLFSLIFAIIFIAINVSSSPIIASKSIKESLELSPKYVITWSIDEGSDKIEFELIVETKGFVGFGLSPTGGMNGADILIAGILENGTKYFSDYHGVNHSPVLDESQDWDLLSVKETETHTILRVSRLLNTCDDQDIPITFDTAKLIWSFGETDEIQMHLRDNRGTKSINLLIPPKKVDLSGFLNWTITVNTSVPKLDTTYWCTFHKSPIPLDNEKFYIVGWNSIPLEGEAAKYTHHVDVKKCKAPKGSSAFDVFDKFVGLEGVPCYDNPEEYPIHYCETYVLTWAVGRGLTFLPENVGYPISESPEDYYYVLEAHYDNPTLDDIPQFTTGLDIQYTNKEREYKADLLGVGHYTIFSLTVPPNVTDYVISGHCASGCTNYFPKEGITVFSALTHSHLSGRKLKLRHFRDGKELPWLSVDNNFDFNFQENKPIDFIKILPGDHITYECTYDTTWKNGKAVIAGLGSREEMCISWLWYYPKIEMNYCYSYYPFDKTFNELGIQEYEWDTLDAFAPPPFITAPKEMANKTYQEVLDNVIDWTLERKETMQRNHQFGDHNYFCFNGKTSEMMPIPIDEPITNYVVVDEEYVPEDFCSKQTTEQTTKRNVGTSKFIISIGGLAFISVALILIN